MKKIGPTDIKITHGNIHIDGYPNAQRIVKMPKEPFGKQLADLRLHQSDLIFCEQAIQKYRSFIKTPENTLDIDVYLTAILAKYFICFKKSKGRESLNKINIFSNNHMALQAFDYFESLRDKHIIHDENPLNLSITSIILGENNKVIDVFSLMISAHFGEDPGAENLHNLIVDTLKYVNFEIDKCLSKCFEWLNTISTEELKNYPDLKTDWPDTSQVIGKTRDY